LAGFLLALGLTSDILEKREVIVGKDVDVKKKLEIADGYVKTVRKNISISDLKLKGTQPIDEKVKYTLYQNNFIFSLSKVFLYQITIIATL
jgi:hypothetical protein